MSGAERLVRIARRLRDAVEELRFGPPAAYVYDPLVYAWKPHRRYLLRYGEPPKRVLMVGMNPGPFGMVQTGVPFGEVAAVRDWLGIHEPVGRPPREHPKRPVQGFSCPRSEVSGRRLWGWARRRFCTPERFFAKLFVWNYCPLAFLEESGRNLTPDKLPAAARRELFAVCDAALEAAARALAVSGVIGIGAFAARRAGKVFSDQGLQITQMPHPSPASPRANRGWEELADAALAAAGIRP